MRGIHSCRDEVVAQLTHDEGMNIDTGLSRDPLLVHVNQGPVYADRFPVVAGKSCLTGSRIVL